MLDTLTGNLTFNILVENLLMQQVFWLCTSCICKTIIIKKMLKCDFRDINMGTKNQKPASLPL